MPDLLKISFVFAWIVLLLRKKIQIGYVLIAASGLLAFFYFRGLSSLLDPLRNTLLSVTAIKLLFALSFIRIFELVLREKEVLSGMTTSISNFIRNRKLIIVSMPVLIGMLPSLGGAYFSAPMVKEATSGLGMSREERAFINYWFRHPWEFVLPLYPGILLASAISGIPLNSLIVSNLLCALLLLATGFVYSMRDLGPIAPPPRVPGKNVEKKGAPRAALAFLPFLAVLFLVVLGGVQLHYALLLIISFLVIFYRYRPAEILRFLKYGLAPEIVILIFGTFLFKETLETSGAVKALSSYFIAQGIPVVLVLCVLPFIAGLITGLTVGFVGSTFPLLISIAGGANRANMSLAFAAGFLGVLCSPVHICLVLSREYFKAELPGMYRRILAGAAFIFVAAIAEFMLLR